MKTKAVLAMALCATIGLTNITMFSAYADDKKGEHEEHAGKDGKLKIPDTAEGIFKAIHEHHLELGATVKSKKLADVHHHAFAIRDLANALPAKAAADKKAQAQGTVKNIAKLAGELDESGDANDQAKTETNLKKLDGLLKVLETQFAIKMEGKEEHKH